jgi:hypothetical protein
MMLEHYCKGYALANLNVVELLINYKQELYSAAVVLQAVKAALSRALSVLKG